MDQELQNLELQYQLDPSPENTKRYVTALIQANLDEEIDFESSLGREISWVRYQMGLKPLRDPENWGGYRGHQLAPLTHTLIVLVRSSEADIDTSEGRYALICDEHGNLQYGDTMSELVPQMPIPEDWCPDCRQELD